MSNDSKITRNLMQHSLIITWNLPALCCGVYFITYYFTNSCCVIIPSGMAATADMHRTVLGMRTC